MINYFDFIACITLYYTSLFIKEKLILKTIKLCITTIITVTSIVIILMLPQSNKNSTILMITTVMINIILLTIIDFTFLRLEKYLFSPEKHNKKFNKENPNCEIDNELIKTIFNLYQEYKQTKHNVFNPNNSEIRFHNITELLYKNKIHSVKNFINNIEYIKTTYNPKDTHLNEYNYINKTLYDFYNKKNNTYNYIKEHLKN